MTDLDKLPDVEEEAPKKRGRKAKEVEAVEEAPQVPNTEPAEVAEVTLDEKAGYIKKASEIAQALGAAIIAQNGSELVLLGANDTRKACNMDNYETVAQAVNKLRAMGL
jgi:hypothetical protein